MSKKYKHLLFDLDHTIWDFDENSKHVIRELYEVMGLNEKIQVEFEVFFKTFFEINEKMWIRYRKGFIKQDELRWKRFWWTLLEFKIADENLSRELSVAYLAKLPTQSRLMPNAIEVLDYCQAKGYGMHIITNGFEETQINKMMHSNILHYFHEIITSEKCLSLKPQKEIYDFTLSTIKAEPEECLMIGDNYDVDIIGAIHSNIDQVFYDPKKIFQAKDATFYISDLRELKEIL